MDKPLEINYSGRHRQVLDRMLAEAVSQAAEWEAVALQAMEDLQALRATIDQAAADQEQEGVDDDGMAERGTEDVD